MTEISKNAQVPQCDKTAVMQSVMPSELRIGNLINYGKAYQNRYENPLVIFATDLEDTSDYEPILITEEWLLKFGFSKELDSFYRIKNSYLVEVLFHDKGITISTQSVCLNHIIYLHQLQNLYFSLTGCELTVA